MLSHPCSLWFIIMALVLSYLIKLLFSGFLPFKINFVCGQNNSKYRLSSSSFIKGKRYQISISPFCPQFPIEKIDQTLKTCMTTFSNTSSTHRIQKLFSAFGNEVKLCLSCLIQYLSLRYTQFKTQRNT